MSARTCIRAKKYWLQYSALTTMTLPFWEVETILEIIYKSHIINPIRELAVQTGNNQEEYMSPNDSWIIQKLHTNWNFRINYYQYIFNFYGFMIVLHILFCLFLVNWMTVLGKRWDWIISINTKGFHQIIGDFSSCHIFILIITFR